MPRGAHDLDVWGADIPRDLDFFCATAFKKQPNKKLLSEIDRAYNEIPQAELPGLIDRWQNTHRRLYLHYFRRYELSNDVVHLTSVLAQFPRSVGLLLMNAGSGYVREAAIKAWGQTCEVVELPFLFARLNDWVPSVRQAAKEQVDRLTSCLSDEDTLLLLGNFYRLSLGKRHDADDLVRRMYARILNNEELLERVISGQQAKLAQQFLALAWDAEYPRLCLLKWARNSVFPVLKAQALNLVSGEEVNTTEQEAALQLFAKDKSPTVRKAFMRLSRQVGGEQWKELIATSLWDRSKGVRQSAQFEAKRLFAADFAADAYSSALLGNASTSSKKAIAVHGCAETGVKLEINLLRECFDSNVSALQRAVFTHANVPVQWAWDCFDPKKSFSLTVCCVAAEYLKSSGGLTSDEVLNAFRENRQNKRQLVVVGLISALPFWERLHVCLVVWQGLQKEHRHRAEVIIAGWLSRTNFGVRPTKALFEAIEQQIALLESVQDPSLRLDEIKLAIKAWQQE